MVRYGLGAKAKLARNLPCMQIFVICAEAFFKVMALKAKHENLFLVRKIAFSSTSKTIYLKPSDITANIHIFRE